MPIPDQRHLFDIPDNIAYLNCAYLSPLLKTVAAAGQQGVARKSRPWEITGEDFDIEIEIARARFAALIGATADDIAVIPAASYGMAHAARNVPVAAGDNIVLLADQFPSNVAPWRQRAGEAGAEIRTVARPADDDWTPAVLAAIDARTAVVALPNCHWTDGTLVDLEAAGAAARGAGAALCLDLTQSIGAMPFDVAAVQPGFMVAAGYKWMMGPYSLGFMYAAPRWHDGIGFEHNWALRSNDPDFARMRADPTTGRIAARRYDMGEAANFALMPMAIAALDQLLAWDPAETQASLRALTDDIATRAEAAGLRVAARDRRAGHYIGLRFADGVPEGIIPRLGERGVYVSQRGDSLRVTPHLYNDARDVAQLFDALQHLGAIG